MRVDELKASLLALDVSEVKIFLSTFSEGDADFTSVLNEAGLIHWVVKHNQENILKHLLSIGCDSSTRDAQMTPSDLATALGYDNIVAALKLPLPPGKSTTQSLNTI